MNVAKLRNLYFGFYEAAKKKMISRYNRKVAAGYLSDKNILTAEEKKQAVEFWAPYVKIDPVFHAFFKEKSGMFCPDWLPTDVYINYIDEYFNDRNASHVLDNKSLYARLFPGIPQIDSVVSRMGKFWYDSQQHMISEAKMLSVVEKEPALFVKAATQSYGGKGVQYIDSNEGNISQQFLQTVKKMPGDIVVQRPVRQHPVFARLNPSSANTLRILSLLTPDGVKVYSGVVRMGVGNTKLDNATAGGVFCGIVNGKTLGNTAYRLTGESFKTHPTTQIVFDGYEIVGYDKAIELIEKAHPMVPYFRMISWDIIIDENGDAHMLEANFSKGCLDFHQLTKGPLFGEDTKKILDEVFGRK